MIAASEEYHKGGVVVVSPANTSPIVTERGYLEVSCSVGRNDMQGITAQQFAYRTFGARGVYLLHDKSTYGQGTVELFRQAAERDGMEVLGFVGTEEQNNLQPSFRRSLATAPVWASSTTWKCSKP